MYWIWPTVHSLPKSDPHGSLHWHNCPGLSNLPARLWIRLDLVNSVTRTCAVINRNPLRRGSAHETLGKTHWYPVLVLSVRDSAGHQEWWVRHGSAVWNPAVKLWMLSPLRFVWVSKGHFFWLYTIFQVPCLCLVWAQPSGHFLLGYMRRTWWYFSTKSTYVFSLTLYPESFTFIEIEIIRSHVHISFHRVTLTYFGFNVLSYVLGGKNNINIPWNLFPRVQLPFSYRV